MSSTPPLRIALVAGEASGDQLGAELIEALRDRLPEAQFAGIGGPRMVEAGLDAWWPADRLAVMGLAEVLRHLPALLRLRRQLVTRLLAWRPDVFVGIDAPDFNLTVERRLKSAGVRTIHYVSPSVWAWREKRAAKIGRSADRVLCLFPMEPAIYARHGVDARFVGHPLADRFALDPDRNAARRELGLPGDAPVLALLPGSRLSEVRRLGPSFIEAAQHVARQVSGLRVIAPMASSACRDLFERLVAAGAAIGADPAEAGIRPRDDNAVGAASAAFGADPAEAGIRARDDNAVGAASAAFGADPAEAGIRARDDNAVGAASAAFGADPAEAGIRARDDSAVGAASAATPFELRVMDGQAHAALVAADVVLLASGTAALEALLAKRPMVVGYRVSPLTAAIVRAFGLMKVDRYSLPNVLAGEALVPELIQGDCTPGRLADAVLRYFREPSARDAVIPRFRAIHESLRRGASGRAADAVVELVAGGRAHATASAGTQDRQP